MDKIIARNNKKNQLTENKTIAADYATSLAAGVVNTYDNVTNLAGQFNSAERLTTKQSIGPGTMLNPVPAVVVSCGTETNTNLLTIAWTGTLNTKPPMLYISVRPNRHSYQILKSNPRFIVNLVDDQLVRELDFCGVRTGAKIDKIQTLGLDMETLVHGYPLAIQKAPVHLLCEVTRIIPLGSHDCFMAQIMDVYVAPHCLDAKGAVDLEKVKLFSYAHGNYYRLGDWLGFFGFSMAKPDVWNRRLQARQKSTPLLKNNKQRFQPSQTVKNAKKSKKTRTKAEGRRR